MYVWHNTSALHTLVLVYDHSHLGFWNQTYSYVTNTLSHTYTYFSLTGYEPRLALTKSL